MENPFSYVGSKHPFTFPFAEVDRSALWWRYFPHIWILLSGYFSSRKTEAVAMKFNLPNHCLRMIQYSQFCYISPSCWNELMLFKDDLELVVQVYLKLAECWPDRIWIIRGFNKPMSRQPSLYTFTLLDSIRWTVTSYYRHYKRCWSFPPPPFKESISSSPAVSSNPITAKAASFFRTVLFFMLRPFAASNVLKYVRVAKSCL